MVPAEQQPEQAPGPRYSSAGEIYLRNPRLPAPSLITESIKSNWGGGRGKESNLFLVTASEVVQIAVVGAPRAAQSWST